MHATAAILFLSGLSGPMPEVEPLPPPTRLPAPAVHVQSLPPGIGFWRPSAYDVWQIRAVGHNGAFLPRVVATPYGAYYLYNGHPYPWTSTRPTDYVQYTSR
jgi:hypothetical protein